MLKKYGYVRAAAAVNKIELGNVDFNVNEIINILEKATRLGVEIILFPELSICGCSVNDLILTNDLYNSCINGLKKLKDYSVNKNIVFIVGCPIRIKNSLFSCGVSISNGSIIGITPKTYIDSYDSRYYSSGEELSDNVITLLDEDVIISNKLIYKCNNYDFGYAVEFASDLANPNSTSNFTTCNGADIVFNLSNAYEIAGSSNYYKDLVIVQAKKTLSAYVYATCGVNETSTDFVYSGYAVIAEPDGTIIENKKYSFESSIIYQDIDVYRINNDKLKNKLNNKQSDEYYEVSFSLEENNNKLCKVYSKTPFLNHTNDEFEEILEIQAMALAKRVSFLGNCKMIIGISGGSDSTLAFLVALRAVRKLNLPATNIIAITMPGFGTSGRTYENSKNLIIASGADFREIPIKDACIKHFEDINHDWKKYDITYENAQARERTQILFDVANKENGIVVGTGDLSELALGWATFNGDHMANYGVNSSIPKTLVVKLISYIRDHEEGVIRDTLSDILSTPISPELLPLDDNGDIKQITERNIGPYVLHDFFLYHLLRYGASVKKIYFLACNVFEEYSNEEILRVLKLFIRRFFTQAFKRNCVCDGIKVGSVSLSPRGDMRMTSDMSAGIYLKELDEL